MRWILPCSESTVGRDMTIADVKMMNDYTTFNSEEHGPSPCWRHLQSDSHRMYIESRGESMAIFIIDVYLQ